MLYVNFKLSLLYLSMSGLILSRMGERRIGFPFYNNKVDFDNGRILA